MLGNDQFQRKAKEAIRGRTNGRAQQARGDRDSTLSE